MTARENWKLYNSKRWKHKRQYQLKQYPLCAMCLGEGRVAAATVVDHIVPHRGNSDLFYNGALQSLCERHHNSTKQQVETLGYSKDIGLDGWPTHPNHPANRSK
jgi:5-methylcytosine-specific restriction enzyme A